MQTNEFSKLQEGITGVMGFYGKSVSTFALDVWWNALRSYDLPSVVEAFNRHLANPDIGQFPPKPADIIRMLQGSTQDAALRAWAKVDQAVRRIGTYDDVVFDDAIIHRVIQDMGGWIALGTKGEDEWPFVAKEFENRYRGFRARSEIPEYPPKLVGIANAHNKQHGFEDQAPILIGNELAARQVMYSGSDNPAIGFKRLDESVDLPKKLSAVA